MKKICLAILLASTALSAHAGDLNNLTALSQAQFRLLSEDLTGALSYKAVAPGEPLGITGFDVGVEVSGTKLQNAGIWKTAGGSDVSTLPIPKIHAHKGLPLNIDIGAFYTAIPNSNVKVYGGEVRYAILEGGVASPSLSVRGAMSKMTGVDQLDFNSQSAEITLSKGVLMFTPYIGAGRVWAKSTPHAGGLLAEKINANKVFAGTNISLGLVNIAFEADKTGDNTSYSAKFGLRW